MKFNRITVYTSLCPGKYGRNKNQNMGCVRWERRGPHTLPCEHTTRSLPLKSSLEYGICTLDLLYHPPIKKDEKNGKRRLRQEGGGTQEGETKDQTRERANASRAGFGSPPLKKKKNKIKQGQRGLRQRCLCLLIRVVGGWSCASSAAGLLICTRLLLYRGDHSPIHPPIKSITSQSMRPIIQQRAPLNPFITCPFSSTNQKN